MSKGNWKLPDRWQRYFDPHYDDAFKAKHPILYALTVAGILVLALIGPALYWVVFTVACPELAFSDAALSTAQKVIAILGFACSFGISIGLCNIFMILHKQYLGHLVTLISFAVGMIGIAATAVLMPLA